MLHKPLKILIKISNTTEGIESNIQNDEALRIYDLIVKCRPKSIFIGFIEGVLEAVQVSRVY